MKSKDFILGIKDGIPIGLGYLSVSFGFGITAVRLGISVLSAFIISKELELGNCDRLITTEG